MAQKELIGTYVPESKRDTRYYIFRQLWRCRVPLLQMKTEQELSRFGMPTVGDRDYDMAVANECDDRMLTIAEIMEAFNRGVRVQIVNPADTEKMYLHIQNHLKAWEQAIIFSYNAKAPTDELIALDQFAEKMFNKAKYFMTGKPIEDGIARDLSSVLRFNRENIIAPKKVTTINKITDEVVEEESPADALQRESLVDMFHNNRTSYRRRS